MRLTTKERHGLTTAVATVLGADGWELFLYGSRIDDKARGGDIDLLLLCAPPLLAAAKAGKRKILVEAERQVGERRIDLTVASKDPTSQSEFVAAVLQKAIPLR